MQDFLVELKLKRHKWGRAGPRSKPSRFEVGLNWRVSKCFRNSWSPVYGFKVWEIILAAASFHLTLWARIWELLRSEIVGFWALFWTNPSGSIFWVARSSKSKPKPKTGLVTAPTLKNTITFDSVISSLRRTGALDCVFGTFWIPRVSYINCICKRFCAVKKDRTKAGAPIFHENTRSTKVKFRGDHGISFEGTRVSHSVLQAWRTCLRFLENYVNNTPTNF